MDLKDIIKECVNQRNKKRFDSTDKLEYMKQTQEELNKELLQKDDLLSKILKYKFYDCLKLTSQLNKIPCIQINESIKNYQDKIKQFITSKISANNLNQNIKQYVMNEEE